MTEYLEGPSSHGVYMILPGFLFNVLYMKDSSVVAGRLCKTKQSSWVSVYPKHIVSQDHGSTLPNPENFVEGFVLQVLMHPNPRLVMEIA